MGGRIALAAAVRAPQRVSRLVLESASPGLATEEEQRGRREADERLASRIESDGIEAFVDFWEEQPLFATRKELEESVRDRQRQIRLANRPEALAACLRGLGTGRQPSFWPRLRDLDMPVLVLAGDRDRKFAGIGYRMGSAIPGGSFVLVPGAGHTVHLEQPEKWIGTILAFLQR
jgi:2-succinyl-6-hydroxy-2,4-cyclohexadiene-1-carboxylate synthase